MTTIDTAKLQALTTELQQTQQALQIHETTKAQLLRVMSTSGILLSDAQTGAPFVTVSGQEHAPSQAMLAAYQPAYDKIQDGLTEISDIHIFQCKMQIRALELQIQALCGADTPPLFSELLLDEVVLSVASLPLVPECVQFSCNHPLAFRTELVSITHKPDAPNQATARLRVIFTSPLEQSNIDNAQFHKHIQVKANARAYVRMYFLK